MPVELLLLSNSRLPGRAPLEHVRDELFGFLAGAEVVHFAAHALHDRDAYAAQIAELLEPYGVRTVALHSSARPLAAIDEAEVLFVGGGNTFRLLAALRATGILETVRERVLSGALRYLGSSAGSNLAAPTIRTTNDMPIVDVAPLGALGLVPFQINPHYLDADPASQHMGETRAERIAQFLEENDVPVVGLREGAWLRREGDVLRLGGPSGAMLFRRGAEPEALADGADLSFLLEADARFDVPG